MVWERDLATRVNARELELRRGLRSKEVAARAREDGKAMAKVRGHGVHRQDLELEAKERRHGIRERSIPEQTAGDIREFAGGATRWDTKRGNAEPM